MPIFTAAGLALAELGAIAASTFTATSVSVAALGLVPNVGIAYVEKRGA